MSEEETTLRSYSGRLRLLPSGGWGSALVVLAALGMAFLACMTLATALAANRLGAEWQTTLSGSATVRLPGDANDTAEIEAAVLDILRATPGIAEARPLAREEQAALLEPWLGGGVALSSLPVPRLIDVTLSDTGPDLATLRPALEAIAPGAVYDDHDAWRGPLIEGAAAIQRLALAASLLVAVAAAGVVALAARASLAGNVEIVRVIRLIGGEEHFIVRAFVRPLAWRTGLGAAVGAGAAALALAFLPEMGRSVGLDLAPEPERLVALAAGVAGVSALVGWGAAQLAVRRALAELP